MCMRFLGTLTGSPSTESLSASSSSSEDDEEDDKDDEVSISSSCLSPISIHISFGIRINQVLRRNGGNVGRDRACRLPGSHRVPEMRTRVEENNSKLEDKTQGMEEQTKCETNLKQCIAPRTRVARGEPSYANLAKNKRVNWNQGVAVITKGCRRVLNDALNGFFCLI
ncbi:hypothetical protein K438DRAFT_1781335 [Mycena galopus ATCC 62051]|nr:hypothetical protein K438DRAFT_1781335 [Mycena galopus ATCC 62051]